MLPDARWRSKYLPATPPTPRPSPPKSISYANNSVRPLRYGADWRPRHDHQRTHSGRLAGLAGHPVDLRSTRDPDPETGCWRPVADVSVRSNRLDRDRSSGFPRRTLDRLFQPSVG